MARGYANVTYLVVTDGGRYLMKITDRGPARVERAVRGSRRARAGGVPTPRVIAHDTTSALLPPFWIQEFLEGEDASRSWPELSGADREAVGRLFGEAVALMHSLPFRDDDRALPTLLRDRFAVSLTKLRELGEFDADAGREVERALDRQLVLLERVEPRLTHTDLHLENVLIPPDRPVRSIALLDFEQTHGSDPAEDFPKLLWWSFSRFPELRAPFYEGYGAPERHGDRFGERVELFCLYLAVAGIRYFLERRDMDDPLRPYIKVDNAQQLTVFRERFSRWRSTGQAC